MIENCSRATPRSASLSNMRMELQRKGVAKPIHGQKRSTSTYRNEGESRCGVVLAVGVQKFVGFTIVLARIMAGRVVGLLRLTQQRGAHW